MLKCTKMQKPVISTQWYLCMEGNHVLTTTNQHTNQIYCTAVSTLSCDLAMVNLFFCLFCLFRLRSAMCLRSSFPCKALSKNNVKLSTCHWEGTLKHVRALLQWPPWSHYSQFPHYIPPDYYALFYFFTFLSLSSFLCCYFFVVVVCFCIHKRREMTSVRTHSTFGN